MTDNFLFFQPWVGLVLSVMGVLYIVFSIRYTEKRPFVSSSCFTEIMDIFFLNKNQIIQSTLNAKIVHVRWQDHRYITQEKDDIMIWKLVSEIVKKHKTSNREV